MAGVLGKARSGRIVSFVGDGLVPVDSALGGAADASALEFDQRTVIEGVGHLALVRHPAVWDHLARLGF